MVSVTSPGELFSSKKGGCQGTRGSLAIIMKKLFSKLWLPACIICFDEFSIYKRNV